MPPCKWLLWGALPFIITTSLPAQPLAPSSAVPSATGGLTLHDALERAFQQHPALRALEHEIRASDAEAHQAGLLPNPELEGEVEDFLGGNNNGQDLSDFGGAEATLVVSQLIELGGKRGKRQRLAETGAALAEWDYEAMRLNLVGQVQSVFLRLLAAQERLRLTRELLQVSETAHETMVQRAQAGKISPLESRRTEVVLTSLTAQAEQSAREVESLRRELATLWGDDNSDFESVQGNLDRILPLPSYSQVRDDLSRNPQLARYKAEIAHRRAALELARARGVPDFSVGAGVRYFNESENHAFLVGFSIPLPLFDRNQGNVEAARERIQKTEALQQDRERQLKQQLAEAWGRLEGARESARVLKEEALPLSRDVYESTLSGFRQGEFELIDVLDAQRALIDTRTQLLDSLVAYHKGMTDMELLTGKPLHHVRQASTLQQEVAE